MAWQVSKFVWNSSPERGTFKLVLLALAEHADATVGECWPAVSTLARYCGLSERHVTRILSKLEETGSLERVQRQGRTSMFRIAGYTPDARVTPDAHVTTTPDTGVTPTPDVHVTPPLTPASPTPDTGVTRTIKNQQATIRNNHQENQKGPPAADTHRPAPATPDAFLLDWQNRWRWYIQGRGLQRDPAIERMTLVRVDDRDGKLTLVFTSRHVNSEPLVMQSAGGRMARNFARDLQVDRIEFVKGELNGTGY